MNNIPDKLEYNLTEEELRELLADLPNTIRDSQEENEDLDMLIVKPARCRRKVYLYCNNGRMAC